MQVAAPSCVRNRLLAGLPSALLPRILSRLRPVSLGVREILLAAEKAIESVYFVETGLVSLVAMLEDGTQAEFGIVGCEGMVGLPLALGVETTFEEAVVRVDGTALQIGAAAFRQLLNDAPELHCRLLRYSEAMRALASQTAACNGRHSLEQRLARWLLMAHDRLECDVLPVTQELAALMLCVYRPSVTVAAGILQRAGIIRYGRGHVAVLDRAGLEAVSCDCYAVVNRRFGFLLGSNHV
jgi:CRP-like cAMP-binding protein